MMRTLAVQQSRTTARPAAGGPAPATAAARVQHGPLSRGACACGGACPRCTQRDLSSTASTVLEDPSSEQEADRIADAVLSSLPAWRIEPVASDDAQPSALGRTDQGSSTGVPLDATTRGLMRSSTGPDLPEARLHTDAETASVADRLGADAYTVGQHIGFAAGAYRPDTPAGRHLIAHELAHVAQQAGGPPRLQLQKRGSSRLEERIHGTSTSSGAPGVWEGTVFRREFIGKDVLIHEGLARLVYDENSCTVTLPVEVAFRHPIPSDLQRCPPVLGGPPPAKLPKQVSATTFERIANRYLAAVNERLNGWYAVRFEGCPENPCAGKTMPIRAQATRSNDFRFAFNVVPVNMKGRSCVAREPGPEHRDPANPLANIVVLYATGISDWTLAHEAGHMALGAGDEYEEPGYPIERVRDEDWSLMGNQLRFGDWSLLHERHFAHVPFFLNHVRPGCDARLVELDRPRIFEGRLSLGAGYARLPGEHGIYLSGGLDLDIPLDRLRETQAVVGVHGTLLGGLGDKAQQALLLGARLGLRHTKHRSAGGRSAQLFAELGRGWFAGDTGPTERGWYGEIGGQLGYTSRFSSDWLRTVSISLEAAAGTRLDTIGPLGAPDAEDLRWMKLGFSIVIAHH